MAERPLGVSIICILGFLGAILSILAGVALLALPSLTEVAGAEIPVLFGGFPEIAGIIVLIIGIATLIALVWLWQMKKIGWTIIMVLEIISIIMAIVQMQMVNLIIPLIIIIYLWTKKDLFK